MPLTTLQKRWLKAILSDPRIALFDPDTSGLEDVEPLYSQDTFVRFDQYTDGDPYSDPYYVHCFRMVLQAIHENRKMRIRFHGHTGVRHSFVCNPYRLEYSEKDDKFRILVTGMRRTNTINMARIRSCELLEEYNPGAVRPCRKDASKHLRYFSMMSAMAWSVSYCISPILKRRRRSWTSGYIESHSDMTKMMKQSC